MRIICSVLFSNIAFMEFPLHFHRNNLIKRSCLEYRQFKPSQVDHRANNSEVINSRAVLSADRSARPQGLSPLLIYSWFQTPASETLFRTSVLTMAGRSRALVCTSTSRAVSYIWRCVQRGIRCTRASAVESTRRMRGWARKMERGCRRPCKNKELVFFLVRKSVNTSGVFATRLLVVVSNWWMYVDVEMLCCRNRVRIWKYLATGKKVTRLGVYPIKSTRYLSAYFCRLL